MVSIVASVLHGPAPLAVHFDGSGSHDPDGSIVSWAWNFGDGATGTGPSADHTYTTVGWTFASLTVTDDSGLTATEYASIEVVTDGVDAPATSDEATSVREHPVRVLTGARRRRTTSRRSSRRRLVSSSSRLEHTWSLSVAAGSHQTFYLDAYHSSNNEGDNFIFEYSRDGASWTPMITVTKTADNDVLQSYAFTQDVTGPIHVRVRDLDRTTGRTKLDTVSIDQMYVASKASMGVNGEVARGTAFAPRRDARAFPSRASTHCSSSGGLPA